MTTVSPGEQYEKTLSRLRLINRFLLLTVGSIFLLIGWGGFVTSIDAGLAVPDWPTSFDSWDALNPWPEWWTITPVLAEHGHRLIGAVVGILTVCAAVLLWMYDPRPGVKGLALTAVVIVVLQGILGGLRVVLISLDLAIVHACLAQIFLAAMVALWVMTTRAWLERPEPDSSAEPTGLRVVAWLTAAALFGQIILGALLRHPGQGISLTLAVTHIVGAGLVVVMLHILASRILKHRPKDEFVKRTLVLMGIALIVQLTLGFTAYFVLLTESGMLIPSNLQVVVNTSHVVVGALLWTSTVAAAVWIHGTEPPVEVSEPTAPLKSAIQ